MFDTYAELLPILTEWLTKKFPKTPEDTDSCIARPFAPRRSTQRAASCQRAPFPTSVFTPRVKPRSLLLHMRAHPLLEVRLYGHS